MVAASVFAAASANAQDTKAGKTVEGRLIDAVGAMEGQQFKEAMSILEGILSVDPTNDAAYY